MWLCFRSRDRRTKSRESSRSRHRVEKKKKSHREKKEERKYSQSRSRSKSVLKKSPSVEKAPSRSSKRRSPDRKIKKISEERVRDYDAEEKIGMDDNGCEKSSSKSDNMDISPWACYAKRNAHQNSPTNKLFGFILCHMRLSSHLIEFKINKNFFIFSLWVEFNSKKSFYRWVEIQFWWDRSGFGWLLGLFDWARCRGRRRGWDAVRKIIQWDSSCGRTRFGRSSQFQCLERIEIIFVMKTGPGRWGDEDKAILGDSRGIKSGHERNEPVRRLCRCWRSGVEFYRQIYTLVWKLCRWIVHLVKGQMRTKPLQLSNFQQHRMMQKFQTNLGNKNPRGCGSCCNKKA